MFIVLACAAVLLHAAKDLSPVPDLGVPATVAAPTQLGIASRVLSAVNLLNPFRKPPAPASTAAPSAVGGVAAAPAAETWPRKFVDGGLVSE